MNLTSFQPKRRVNVEIKNNTPVNNIFVAKTSDIRNVSQNMRSDIKTSEMATLLTATEQTINENVFCFY